MSLTTQSDLEVSELYGRLDERTERIASQVEKLVHTILEGNGSPSLIAQIAILREKVNTLESASGQKRLSGGDRAVIYTTALGGLVTLVEMIMRHAVGK
jgi:hypothetical protein